MVALKIPRLFGEINDKDTQFTAALKTHQEFVLIGGVILILAILYGAYSFYAGMGRTGSWRYGLCKVFLEQYSYFPDSLKILDAQEGQTAARIRFVMAGPYGGYESKEIECIYNVRPDSVTLSRVTIDRRPIDLLSRQQSPKPQRNDNQTVETPDTRTLLGLYEENFNTLSERGVMRVNIDNFNRAIPAIMASGMLDTSMPPKMPTEIENLKYD